MNIELVVILKPLYQEIPLLQDSLLQELTATVSLFIPQHLLSLGSALSQVHPRCANAHNCLGLALGR